MRKLNYNSLFKQLRFNILFFLLSIMFFIILIMIVFDAQIKRDYFYETIDNAVVDFNCHSIESIDKCNPAFTFNYNSVRYVCVSETVSRDDLKTNHTSVYFNGENPMECITEYDKEVPLEGYLFMLVPIISMLTSLLFIIIVIIKIFKFRKLAKYGTLIKDLKYKMVPSNIVNKGRRLMSIYVIYEPKIGEAIHCVGEPRYDGKELDEDGFVDLLIDLKHPKNFYIGFDIK